MKTNVIILASKGVLKWSTNINLSKSAIVMFKGAKQLVVNHFIPLKPSLAVLIWTSNHKPDIKALLTWLFDVCSLSEMPKSLNLKVANKYHECITGGSLRFWTGGQLSLTTGQIIGKALRALPSGGPYLLGGSGGMLPQKILKFYSRKDVFSCILKLQTVTFKWKVKSQRCLLTSWHFLYWRPFSWSRKIIRYRTCSFLGRHAHVLATLIHFRWLFMKDRSFRNVLWGDSCF